MDAREPHLPDEPATGIAGFAADLAGCLRFFSRLPVPAFAGGDPAAMPDFSRAARALSLAGLILAAPAALCLFLLGLTNLPPLLIAALTLAMLAAATGALHEDGLADMADGFGGGRETERVLAIMKDSRIGSFGAVALVLSLAARLAGIATLVQASPAWGALALLAAAAMSRASMAWIWYALPAIRSDGASHAAGRPDRPAFYLNLAIGAVLTLLLVVPGFGLSAALLAFALALAAAVALGAYAMRRIGGQTGDVLGAGQQVAEVAFFIGLLI